MGSKTTLTPRVSTDTGSLQEVGGGGDGVRGDVGEGCVEGVGGGTRERRSLCREGGVWLYQL